MDALSLAEKSSIAYFRKDQRAFSDNIITRATVSRRLLYSKYSNLPCDIANNTCSTFSCSFSIPSPSSLPTCDILLHIFVFPSSKRETRLRLYSAIVPPTGDDDPMVATKEIPSHNISLNIWTSNKN